jgi:hypothetical protein
MMSTATMDMNMIHSRRIGRHKQGTLLCRSLCDVLVLVLCI